MGVRVKRRNERLKDTRSHPVSAPKLFIRVYKWFPQDIKWMGIFLSELNTYYKTFFKTSNVWLVRRHNVQRWFTHASLTPLHSSHATSQQCRQEAHVINLSLPAILRSYTLYRRHVRRMRFNLGNIFLMIMPLNSIFIHTKGSTVKVVWSLNLSPVTETKRRVTLLWDICTLCEDTLLELV